MNRNCQSQCEKPGSRGFNLRHEAAGYTLMELLITITIVGFVATMAVPSMTGMIDRTQQASALNSVFAMLNFARSEAVTRQTTISACGSTDQATCNTNNWENGWLVFVDDGAGTGGVADDGNINGTETLLRVGQAAPGDTTIRTTQFTDAGAVSFDDNGMSAERGTFIVCTDTTATNGSAVVVNISGQARIATDDDSTADDIVNNSAGGNISCPS